ncbi:IQ domain-containing protein C-like [Sinocyclocheilus rhinocerous]|uniref:IQ domain-containing protein C-like n=1 Tax=Sinocyclocheilus rhinocerous TaxID=307959 RepID=UPI0007BA1BC8|nr:PREDICTED: IQ domain-containing protein C-like [Sinocyclocheilus rhinocerous]XP_016364113.1 PREDICTED: IQ domain-containing protein C-like [Sinocyclocheilus rhinocerous]
MNEQKWIQTLTRFQAQCRGYAMRKGLSLVRTQFEETVREIDGGLDHLQWRGNIIPRPHFTDTESLLLQYERSRFQSHDLLDDSERKRKTENEGSEKSLPQSEIQVPEKDEATETASRDTSTSVDGIVDKRGENVVIQNLMDDSTALCSIVNSDVSLRSLFQTGPNLHSVFKETAHTPDSLKQQRSTLAMELLWIQQAISSRKKYLTLKQRMDVPH